MMERLIMEGFLEGVAFELCFEKELVRLGWHREKKDILDKNNTCKG